MARSGKGKDKFLHRRKRKGFKHVLILSVENQLGDALFEDVCNIEQCFILQKSFLRTVEGYVERFTLDDILKLSSLMKQNLKHMKETLLGIDCENLLSENDESKIIKNTIHKGDLIVANDYVHRERIYVENEELGNVIHQSSNGRSHEPGLSVEPPESSDRKMRSRRRSISKNALNVKVNNYDPGKIENMRLYFNNAWLAQFCSSIERWDSEITELLNKLMEKLI